MKLEEDKNLSAKISEIDKLPEGIQWTAERGWEAYRRKYRNRLGSLILIWSSIAAILILGIFFVFSENKSQSRVLRFSTAKGTKDILLRDGNKIYLNDYSSISINLKDYKIEVDGEVYFELITQKEFTIRSPHGEYTALNSCFNLRSRKQEERAIISVAKGEVTIKPEKDSNLSFTIETSNEANIIPQVAIIKAPITDINYLSWKTGRLHFENTPLYMVFNKLNDLNETNIEVSDSEIRYCRISFDFNTISSPEVIQKILETFNYKAVNRDSLILIQGSGCERI